MCEFCHKHGEGKTWYLRAENYSQDLLSDLRRRAFIQEFIPMAARLETLLPQLKEKMEQLDRLPGFVRKVLVHRAVAKQKRDHYGQVLPLEDVEKIFDFVTTITRLPCVCRKATTRSEQRYCYGISLAPDGGKLREMFEAAGGEYLLGPDTKGFETLSREEALAAFRDHEREGLCHTVWTFVTPFIGGICNCDTADCLALRCTLRHRMPMVFRAEFVAEVNPERCRGCRQCLRQCQFGALGYSAARKKAEVRAKLCYGCGICRTACAQGAISLVARASVPAAANVW